MLIGSTISSSCTKKQRSQTTALSANSGSGASAEVGSTYELASGVFPRSQNGMDSAPPQNRQEVMCREDSVIRPMSAVLSDRALRAVQEIFDEPICSSEGLLPNIRAQSPPHITPASVVRGQFD